MSERWEEKKGFQGESGRWVGSIVEKRRESSWTTKKW